MTDDQGDDRTGAEQATEPGAWRLTFEQDERGVRLAAAEWVDMIAPAPPVADVDEDAPGSWVELRRDGDVRWRQPVRLPTAEPPEVFSPDGTMHRLEQAEPVGTFQVVVPDLDDVDEVLVRERPPRPPDAKRRPRVRKVASGTLRSRGGRKG